MVRHEAKARLNPQGRGGAAACCACPTGERPVPAGAGASGGWPQVLEGDLRARAGCQKPVRRRVPRSGEQACGPQHEVKPAASTDLQPAGRAAHLTAKAAALAREPKRAGGCGGVWGAARVQGQGWNVRGPSARIEVPDNEVRISLTKAVGHNAAGGKDPCGGHADGAGKRKGMAGQTRPGDPVGEEPSDQVRQLQRQLRVAAKRAPGGRLRVKNPPCGRDDLPAARRADHHPGQPLLAGAGPHNAASRRPPVGRGREIRMHGLNGGVGSAPGLRAA